MLRQDYIDNFGVDAEDILNSKEEPSKHLTSIQL